MQVQQGVGFIRYGRAGLGQAVQVDGIAHKRGHDALLVQVRDALQAEVGWVEWIGGDVQHARQPAIFMLHPLRILRILRIAVGYSYGVRKIRRIRRGSLTPNAFHQVSGSHGQPLQP